MNDVAGGDVFLRLPHVGEELLLRHVRCKLNRRNFDWQTHRLIFAGLLQQGNDPSDFCDRIFIGFCRARVLIEDGVDQHGEGLRDTVENEQLVGDEKIHRRRAQLVLRRSWDDGFDVVNELVTDEANRAAGEPGQTGQGHASELFQQAFDDFEAVLDRRDALSGGGARDQHVLHDASTFNDFDAIVELPNDCARVAADEGVTSQMLAALDRFEKKRFALAANFPIGRQGRFQVSQQTARDRNQVALRREL